jgi:hypothetical protein
VEIENVGTVEVCAMVLPVFWDLAALLVLKEIQAFHPSFVLMNGIAGWRQELWLELGAINRAKALADGSDILVPYEDGAALVPSAPEEELARANLLSWRSVHDGAQRAIDELRDIEFANTQLSDVVHGVAYAGYPRSSNTYLCNNVTYTVGYAMDHPDETLRLLEASHPREAQPDGLDFRLGIDHRATPRAFIHWPAGLESDHLHAGAQILSRIVEAELLAWQDGEWPSRGDNDMADIPPSDGDIF